ncbi:TonB-dependent receptor [Sphingobium phenoxybenzoativorans]|uniref:TonB-dependent receptor n=1 Tax=Sphingobium phenoxybenzoativorans TaxID=1592790 RepID=UPI000872BBA6|nr:TonB-dependent receptor [Sphingobium phenoxybenzoativorans]
MKKMMLLVSGSMVALCQNGAAAQTVSDPTMVEDIVVTAQRRSQSLQDVPISVAVATGDALRSNNVLTLGDLTSRINNVKVNVGGASDVLTVRGVGSGTNAGFEQSVGTFLDGIYLGRSRATRLGFLDIERIEILKGPQSTFFGNNTIAGALSVTSAKPTSTFEGYANLAYAPTDGEYVAEGVVSGPLTNNLSARVAAKFTGMDGFVLNTRTGNKGPDNSDKQGRIALRWDGSDDLQVDFRVDGAQLRDQNQYNFEVLNCPNPDFGTPTGACAQSIREGTADNRLDYVTAVGPSSFDYDMVNSGLTISKEFGESTLTSTTGVFHHKLRQLVQASTGAGVAALGRNDAFPQVQLENYDAYSQELRFQSPTDRWFSYAVGAYFEHNDLKSSSFRASYNSNVAASPLLAGLVPANTPFVQSINVHQKQTTLSGFAALTVKPVNMIEVNLGGRFSRVKKTADRSSVVGTGGQAPDQQFSAFSDAVAEIFAANFGLPVNGGAKVGHSAA